MGGSISVESTVGQGTLFHIRLPLAETAIERQK
jgi:signal transduction histidine kinase